MEGDTSRTGGSTADKHSISRTHPGEGSPAADAPLSRRRFLATTAGVAAAGAVAAGTSGTAFAQAGEPEYDGWFDGVSNYDGTVDERGADAVEVTVGAQGNGGGFAYGPAAVMVSPGTTVVWTWNGEGGAHNVVAEDGSFDSGNPESGADVTFEHTFEEEGVYRYVCTPHEAMGMRGAVVVQSGSGSSDDASADQGPGEDPDYDGWFDDVSNFDGTTADRTGESSVEVTVGAQGNGGGFAYDPPAVRVSPGTTVTWRWTGEGGAHNVVAADESFSSGDPVAETDTTFSQTFDEHGIHEYVCTPHEAMGMKGAVVVSGPADGGAGDASAGPPITPGLGLTGGALLAAFASPVAFALFLRRRAEAVGPTPAATDGGTEERP